MIVLSAVHGCGSDDDGGDPQPRAKDDVAKRVQVLVGELSDSDVKVGVVAAEDKMRLFFCGGMTSVEDSTRWLIAELKDDGSFELEDDGWKLSGQLDSARLTGDLERDDDADKGGEFLAQLIDPETVAGVYEGMDQCGRVGLIVTQPTPDDEATGQGACVGPGHDPQPVGVILPIAVDEDGEIEVELEADGEVRPASVIAALPVD